MDPPTKDHISHLQKKEKHLQKCIQRMDMLGFSEVGSHVILVMSEPAFWVFGFGRSNQSWILIGSTPKNAIVTTITFH